MAWEGVGVGGRERLTIVYISHRTAESSPLVPVEVEGQVEVRRTSCL